VGVFISLPSNRGEINVQVQASAPPTSTPLQAEALALNFAAYFASQLNIAQPTFLTDCLVLAGAATLGNVSTSETPWSIRKSLASFLRLLISCSQRCFTFLGRSMVFHLGCSYILLFLQNLDMLASRNM
uniref:Uncharacterized protein n=1 Tax=Triticum urartu TaxID=4572 RepID=A0A8R7UJH7_TRIUA